MALPHKPPLLPQLARPAKKLNPGDRIRFVAEKVDGAFVASRVEPAR